MNIDNKKIGIWGFGVVGKSAANFLHDKTRSLQIMDKRPLSDKEELFLKTKSIAYINEDQQEKFLTKNDFIVPSAGIDLRPYQHFKHKFIAELDLFNHFFSKPIIALTGTLGKTTLTNLLTKILSSKGFHIAMGGNIGIGLCDLIADQYSVDYAVLEVSSFQLELTKNFAPELAIWTNFYPNHLDRHSTIEDYFAAKLNILRSQKPHQKALLPCALLPKIQHVLGTIPSRMSFFSLDKPAAPILKTFDSNRFFWIENDHIVTQHRGKKITLIARAQLPQNLFIDTALILVATLNILDRSLDIPQEIITTSTALEHRLEKVATINGITFYNDSKATVPEATLAAVNTLQPGPILLLFGGLSKGIDRKPFMQQLKNKVAHVFCFGAEAQQLKQWCTEYSISASKFKNLQKAFRSCKHHAKPGDSVVLSPGGSSFDLFTNYQERGHAFKDLIKSLDTTIEFYPQKVETLS